MDQRPAVAASAEILIRDQIVELGEAVSLIDEEGRVGGYIVAVEHCEQRRLRPADIQRGSIGELAVYVVG